LGQKEVSAGQHQHPSERVIGLMQNAVVLTSRGIPIEHVLRVLVFINAARHRNVIAAPQVAKAH